MKEIFLSASVPLIDRGHYHESSNPFLIQRAVRELIIATIRDYRIVWGGHPSITPMIWSICEDLAVDYSDRVVLYQSLYFRDEFPEENEKFQNTIFIDAEENDQAASLETMRKAMLSRDNLVGAVFIGGMDGIVIEHDFFKHYHPDCRILLVHSPGGAARQLAEESGQLETKDIIDFAKMFAASFELSKRLVAPGMAGSNP